MPRRPMDSSCLWLPPVPAVRCTLLARPAPTDCEPSATAPVLDSIAGPAHTGKMYEILER